MTTERHRWVKVRLHVYICRKCGTGKVNEQHGREWLQRYHRPNGTSEMHRHVPPCEVGPLTAKYLEKHAAVIALAAEGITFDQQPDGAAVPA